MAFMDLKKTPRDVLTIFGIRLIRTSKQSFKNHVGIGSAAQNTLDDLFTNCLISASVTVSNVFIMEMQDSSTNGIPCNKVLEGNRSCLFNIF